MAVMARFIATLAYNGVDVVAYDVTSPETVNQTELLCRKMMKEIPKPSEVEKLASYIKEMLFYRLVSTSEVFQLCYNLLKTV